MIENKNDAFSLFQLLVTLVIIGIIGSIAVVSISSLIDNTRLKADLATVQQLNQSTQFYELNITNESLFNNHSNTSEYLLEHLLDSGYLTGSIKPQTNGASFEWDFDFYQWTLSLNNETHFAPTNPENFTVGNPSTFRITSYNLESGTNIVIPSEIHGETITQIGHASLSDLGLTSVILPDTIRLLAAFSLRNNELTSIKLNEGLETIGNGAFQNNSISEIIIPQSVTNVGDHAFDNNPITQITISDNVTIGNSWSFGIHRPGGGGNFDQVYAAQGGGTYLWNGTSWVKQ